MPKDLLWFQVADTARNRCDIAGRTWIEDKIYNSDAKLVAEKTIENGLVRYELKRERGFGATPFFHPFAALSG